MAGNGIDVSAHIASGTYNVGTGDDNKQGTPQTKFDFKAEGVGVDISYVGKLTDGIDFIAGSTLDSFCIAPALTTLTQINPSDLKGGATTFQIRDNSAVSWRNFLGAKFKWENFHLRDAAALGLFHMDETLTANPVGKPNLVRDVKSTKVDALTFGDHFGFSWVGGKEGNDIRPMVGGFVEAGMTLSQGIGAYYMGGLTAGITTSF